MTKHMLGGCDPTPFSKYLKTLGIFRILAAKDSKVTAYWSNDKFVVDTQMTKEDILEYVLNEYKPTPIVAPWSYNKYKKMTADLKLMLEDERFQDYKETTGRINDAIEEFCRICKIDKMEKAAINDKTKPTLLRLCRNMLPDSAVPWLDAVYVVTSGKMKFAPVLSTGANDGNFDMAENFVKKLGMLLLDGKKKKDSRGWLESTLFGSTFKLENGTTMGHNPDGSGGPNSGMGFEGVSLSNPWEYVLMMEGMMMFGGSIARRLSSNTDKAVFPFTTNSTNAGFATASEDEDGRAEIWLPIWENPATCKEVTHIFNEGRVQINGRQAKTGVEFARAITGFGAERGISEFLRFCILERKGLAYLTINAGRMRVSNEPAVHLLDEIDPWYNKVTAASKKKGASGTLKRLVRGMDGAVIKFCKYQRASHMLEVLVLVGRIDRYISDRGRIKPLQKLSSDWLKKCYDGTPEFRLAASLASMKPAGSVGGMRENLENVTQNKQGVWECIKNSTSCVWNENDSLLRNMGLVLLRRAIDAKIKSAKSIPITSVIPSRIDDIVEFLNGSLNMKRISDLILPLSLIDAPKPAWQFDSTTKIALLPEAYAVLKLIHPPDSKEEIPFDMSVLNLLLAGRLNDAYAKASHMLYAHRMQPLRYSRQTGRTQSTTLSEPVQKRVMPALLFDISCSSRQQILRNTTVHGGI